MVKVVEIPNELVIVINASREKRSSLFYNDTKYQDDNLNACAMFSLGFLRVLIQNNYSFSKYNNESLLCLIIKNGNIMIPKIFFNIGV